MSKINDAILRLSLYVERLKATKARDFKKVADKLQSSIEAELKNINVDKLDDLSRSQLSRLLIAIRGLMSAAFGKYTKGLIKWLSQFAGITRKLVMQITYFERWKHIITGQKELDDDLTDELAISEAEPIASRETLTDPSLMWAAIEKTPISANGLLIGAAVAAIGKAAQAEIENKTRMGWVNGWTVKETIESYQDSFRKIANQEGSSTSTVIQQVYLQTKALTLSAYYRKYIWCSIIDKSTSDMCRGRNGKIYEFGKGPVPPGHYRCRSHIEPYTGSGSNSDYTSLNQWKATQPEAVQTDAFSNEALTLDKYAGRINLILQ